MMEKRETVNVIELKKKKFSPDSEATQLKTSGLPFGFEDASPLI